MDRLGFHFDINKCVGCKACQMACKDKNHVEIGSFFRRVDTISEDGKYIHISLACNHCKDAACVKNCPTNAMHFAKDGTVQHTAGKCIGCGRCTFNCPYGAVALSKQKGIAVKCGSCADLRAKGQAPACVKACITHCLEFKPMEVMDIKELPIFMANKNLTNPSLNIKRKQVD